MGLASAETVTKEIASVAPAYAGISWDFLEWDARDGAVVPLEDAPEVLSYLPVRLKPTKAPKAQLTLHMGSVMYDDGVRLRHCPSLRPLAPGPVARIHPDDARRMGAVDGHAVKVVTSKGEGEFTIVIDTDTPAGVVYIPRNQPGAAKLGADPVVRVTVVT